MISAGSWSASAFPMLSSVLPTTAVARRERCEASRTRGLDLPRWFSGPAATLRGRARLCVFEDRGSVNCLAPFRSPRRSQDLLLRKRAYRLPRGWARPFLTYVYMYSYVYICMYIYIYMLVLPPTKIYLCCGVSAVMQDFQIYGPLGGSSPFLKMFVAKGALGLLSSLQTSELKRPLGPYV